MQSNRPAFFQVQPQDGSLRRAGGERMATLSTVFVHSLHASLLDQFAETAQDVLYRIGYDWGLRDLVQLQRALPAGRDLWQSEAGFVLDTWWTPLAAAGWGECEFDASEIAAGKVVTTLQASVVVAALGPSDHPVCHLYAGLFAAAVSFLTRGELHAAELQCRAAGAPACQFLVAPGPMIDSAEAMRQQGTAAAEILRRVR